MIITLQDTETREISAKIDELHEERMGAGTPAAAAAPAGAPTAAPASDTGVAEALNAVAARIEKICQTI